MCGFQRKNQKRVNVIFACAFLAALVVNVIVYCCAICDEIGCCLIAVRIRDVVRYVIAVNSLWPFLFFLRVVRVYRVCIVRP